MTTKRPLKSQCRILLSFLIIAVAHGFYVTEHHHPVRYQTNKHFFLSAEAANRNLLESLDGAFQYDGRLPSASSDFRCGFVSIIGAPNMGKSTLMNALLQEDLCIATRRPQTTRHAILGVITTADCQLCLVDTPGIIDQPAYKLQEGMMEAVVSAFNDADVLLVVTDLFSTPIPDDTLFQKVQNSRKPVIVVINKIDLAEKVKNDAVVAAVDDPSEQQQRTVNVPDAIQRWRSLIPSALAILPIAASAPQGNNTALIALRKILLGESDVADALRDMGRPIPGMFRPGVKFITSEEAVALLPPSPPLYDAEALTDRPERFFAAEMIRAAILQEFQKEVPYCCEVRITEFKEPKSDSKKPVIRMKATIFVERENQKLIVIGKGGQQIKRVGIVSREQLEAFFQSQVHLELNVQVSENWRNNDDRLKEFGYRL